jgi:hypothetical protein
LIHGQFRSVASTTVLVLALALTGCSGRSSQHGAAKPVRSEPPTSAPTTTTTAPPPPVAPLTGVFGDPTTARRPVLVVKIDNVARAHPQSGITQAAVV